MVRPVRLCLSLLGADERARIVQTVWAWFFIAVIAFRFIPNRVVTRPVAAFWVPCVQEPLLRLPYRVRLAMGWLALLGIVFGSAFGFPLTAVRRPSFYWLFSSPFSPSLRAIPG